MTVILELDDEIGKKALKSLKNEMFILGLCSISNDWLSNPSDKHQPKCQKRPPCHQKIKWLSFGLRSTSDDQLSDLSDES